MKLVSRSRHVFLPNGSPRSIEALQDLEREGPAAKGRPARGARASSSASSSSSSSSGSLHCDLHGSCSHTTADCRVARRRGSTALATPAKRPDSASAAVQVSSPSSCTLATCATVPAVPHRNSVPSSDLASAALSPASADPSASSVPPLRAVPPNTYSNISASLRSGDTLSPRRCCQPSQRASRSHRTRRRHQRRSHRAAFVARAYRPVELQPVRSHPEPVRTRIAHYLAMGAIERCARSDIRATHHCTSSSKQTSPNRVWS